MRNTAVKAPVSVLALKGLMEQPGRKVNGIHGMPFAFTAPSSPANFQSFRKSTSCLAVPGKGPYTTKLPQRWQILDFHTSLSTVCQTCASTQRSQLRDSNEW
eukprot:TRINITY_DN8907_c0_g1_i6.p2 TRINITY_DN8907_c0_g1~~TRINITY_DN8907_c0_g1_i6.p2  ORF type:complete len:102 (-),score=13.88 TRINITY_DN8907_c0_g1_i6:207-512(-)